MTSPLKSPTQRSAWKSMGGMHCHPAIRYLSHCLSMASFSESGAPHDLCGPLRLAMSLNDLSRPLWDRAAEAMTTPEELARLGGLYLNDARELFFRTCGLTGFSTCESAVNHAGMYLEYGWPSPVGCSMIYHRSEWDFFRDLERIYLEYQLGIPYHRALAGLDSVTGMEGMKPPWSSTANSTSLTASS